MGLGGRELWHLLARRIVVGGWPGPWNFASQVCQWVPKRGSLVKVGRHYGRWSSVHSTAADAVRSIGMGYGVDGWEINTALLLNPMRQRIAARASVVHGT
jgi:hypothetical protein